MYIEQEDDFRCDCCRERVNTLYEGWFKAIETNDFNRGTVSDGLMQWKRLCGICYKRFRRNDQVINER